jgi:DNA-directed RNA polymerase II subunit RPB7
MPDEIQYDASATPAQFTNNADIVIEQGTHVRVKIIGLRTEVGEMWAIGSINGDFLGYVPVLLLYYTTRIFAMLTVLLLQLPPGVASRKQTMAC